MLQNHANTANESPITAASLDASCPCGVVSAGFRLLPKAALMSAITPARIAASEGTMKPCGPSVGKGHAVLGGNGEDTTDHPPGYRPPAARPPSRTMASAPGASRR